MKRPYLVAVAIAALVLGGCNGETAQPGPDNGPAGDTTIPRDASGDSGPVGDAGDGAVADTYGPDALLCGGVSCDDKLACTQDLCVASGCLNKVKPGYCVINKTCYKEGDKQGGSGSCRKCDTSKSTTAWTDDVSLCAASGLTCTSTTCSAGTCKTELNKDYCLISNVCIKHGATNPKNACRVCDVNLSTTSYQNITDGSACAADGLACTDDVCKTGACAHPLKAGYCKIGSHCYYKGELSALQDCRVCSPSKSATAWSTVPDGTKCTDDGVSCTTDSCKAGKCVNALAPGYCKINNTCYKSGHTSPKSECQGCVPSKSPSGWSNKPAGSKCTADSLSCTSDTCDKGACTHKLMSSRCLIGGKCYVTGASSPGMSCQGCNPSVSTSGWSLLPNGSSCAADSYVCTDDVCQNGSCTHPLKSGYCRIGGTCYTAGQKNPLQSCLHCDPKSTITNWSGAADGTSCASDNLSCTGDECKSGACTHPLAMGSCLIGNQCYSAGQPNPGNTCQQCVPGASPTGWSSLSNGAGCPGGKCISGGCCKGCVMGSVCHPGADPGACGKGGNNCTQCPTGWACVSGTCTQQSTLQNLDVGPFKNKFSASLTRGFWIQAPTAFTIVGLRVPTDVGYDTQHIQVMRFYAQPPTWAGKTTSYVTLGYYHVAGSSYVNVNIPVSPGQYIGILGARGSSTTMNNSYGNGLYKSSIKGHAVTLTRLLTQQSIASSPAGPVSSEPSGSIGRVEVRYK